ncbi:MAG TPA: winged helix-turn-helix domain-containing protein [Solirubrobacterales bacterium]|nr:winged helix-turn-helix domain-containing protein [Solirubrobacterales bacterium]
MSKGSRGKSSGAGRRLKETEESFGRTPHEQLVRGLSHPLRVKCLSILSERIASPRQITEYLDEDLSNVSYHVRVLSELGLIELVSEEPVRGAVAHFYKAVERPLISAADAEQLPLEVQKAFSAYNWDLLIDDATKAIEKGTFHSRSDWHLTRTPLLLDSQGFARLSKAMDELLELIFAEQAASAERMNKSGEEPTRATAATALFAMPDPK